MAPATQPIAHTPTASLGLAVMLTLTVLVGLAAVPAAQALDLTSVSPNTGTTNGGTIVRLVGSDFEEGARVTFGGVEAPYAVVVDDADAYDETSPAIDFNLGDIKATTPPRSTTGAVSVTVVNPDGTTDSIASGFTYSISQTPTVASLDVISGTTNGGTAVDVTGTNFAPLTRDASGDTDCATLDFDDLVTPLPKVEFGSTPATQVCVETATELSVVAPAHASGAVNVKVTNPDGKSATLTGGFTYANAPVPTIVSVSPATEADSSNGGPTITLVGTGFADALDDLTTVTFGGVPATDVDVTTTTTLTVTLPPHVGGSVDVIVFNPDGQQATKASGFVYENDDAPVLDTVQVVGMPSTYVKGTVFGGTTIRLEGTEFNDDAVVTVGGKPAEILTISDTTITALTPSGTAGVVDVKVQNPDGQISTLAGGFTYFTPVQLTSVSPLQGSTNGGTTVTLTGQGFTTLGTTKPRVFFGDAEKEATVSTATATALTVVSPPFDASLAAADQIVDVRVVNPDGTTAVLHGAYTYVDAVQPTITKVMVGATGNAEDGTNGGATVTVTGTGFSAGTHKPTVTLDDGVVAEPLEGTVLTATSTSLTFTVPPHPDDDTDAEMDVILTNPDGRTATSEGDGDTGDADDNDGFQYTDDDGAPSISPFAQEPTASTNGGGTLTLSGSGFAPTVGDAKLTVTVDGAEATVNSVTATQVVIVVPPHADASDEADVAIVVTNPNGLSDTDSTLDYDGAAVPSVESLSVSSGTSLGRTTVTVNGQNFATGLNKPTVLFDGEEADVGAVTATAITVTTPAHAVGAADVEVENPDGQGASLPGAYTYTTHGSVTIATVSPTSSSLEGGDMLPTVDAEDGDRVLLTITGNNFAKTATVKVGDFTVLADDVTVVSATQITALLPSAADAGVDFSTDEGEVTVRVTNEGSGQSGSLGNGFRYLPPPPTFAGVAAGDRVDPVDRASNGGNTVTLTGMDFSDGTGPNPVSTATIGGLMAEVLDVTEGVEDTIDVVAPAHAAGEVNVQVFDAFGQSTTLRNAYEYFADLPPALRTVGASAGPAAGFSLATLRGTGFSVENPPAVTVGGVAARDVEVVDTTLLTLRTPAHVAGASDVKVTNADGQTSTLTGAFTFLGAGGPPAPTIATVSPTSGPTEGGQTVTITGTNFVSGATVTFGTTPATTTTFVSATQVTAVTPVHAAGTVDVTFTNSDGGTATKTEAYTFATTSTAPDLTSITPTCGPLEGGTVVTLTGTNFVDGATVAFGGTAATAVEFVSATSIEATTPARAAGLATVLLTNPDGQSDSLANAYEYATECDSTPPVGILTVTSDTHEEGEPTLSSDPAFEWNAITDPDSDVTYHYELDRTALTVVSTEDDETEETSVEFEDVEDGTWYFHVRAFSAGGAGDQDDYQIVVGEGTPPEGEITDEDVEAANADLAETLDVTREGDDNVLTWQLPDDLPADPAGVQVWSSNSPFEWLATLEEGDDEFESSTYVDEGAPKGTQYLVTIFYADGVGFGDEDGDGTDIAGFDDLEAASLGGDGNEIPLWVWILIAGAVLLIVLIVIAVVVTKRRKKGEETAAAEGYAWEDQPPAPVATAAAAAPAPTPEPAQEHAMQCPNCKTTFKATGARPLTTVCPGCGKKGILR